jgi:hypothetical protein
MNNQANSATLPRNKKARLDKIFEESPLLKATIQTNTDDMIKSIISGLENESKKLEQFAKTNPEMAQQWAETTIQLMLDIFEDTFSAMNPNEFVKAIECDDFMLMLWKNIELFYMIFLGLRNSLGGSANTGKSYPNIQRLTNAVNNVKVGGMQSGNRTVARGTGAAAGQGSDGVPLGQVGRYAQALGQAAVQGARTRKALDKIEGERAEQTIEINFNKAMKYIGVTSIVAAIGGVTIATTGHLGDLHTEGAAGLQLAGQAAHFTIHLLPFTGKNVYLEESMPEFLWRALDNYNSSLPDVGPINAGIFSLRELRQQAEAYTSLGSQVSMSRANYDAKRATAKLTILNLNGIKNLDAKITAAKEAVMTKLSETRFSLSPARLFNSEATSRNQAYADAKEARAGLVRLKKLVDAEDYIGFAYSPDIKFLGADKAPFEAVQRSDLRAKIGTVTTAVEEEGANPETLIGGNTTVGFNIQAFSNFVNKQAASITPTPGIVNQAFVDWAFSNIISPFHDRFSTYLTDSGDAISTQIQTQNNEMQLLDYGDSYDRALQEVDAFKGRCTSNTKVSRLPTCETLVRPDSVIIIKAWLKSATSVKFVIPPNIIDVLSPYLNTPQLHPTLNRYQIARLINRIQREKNPDIKVQLLYLVISAGMSVYVVMSCVRLASIPKSIVDGIADGFEAGAMVAKTALERRKAIHEAATRDRELASIQAQRQLALENSRNAAAAVLTNRRTDNARLLTGPPPAGRTGEGAAAGPAATGRTGQGAAAARANETLNSNSEGSNNNNAASGRGGRRVRKAKTSKKRHVKKHKGTRRH